jgi:hypothetical protein
MLSNYIKLAYRSIRKNGFYSALNILGLGAGILFALLIGAHTWGELQVNQQLRQSERQYFLTSIWKNPDIGMEITCAGPLGKRLKEVYPHLVANYYRWDGIVLGLVSLNLQRREKELGVRKILGASIMSLVGLFLREFLLILLVAGVIACPIAWYFLQGWLDNYAYHIELNPIIFASSIAGLGLITTLLIGLQSMKAALANPVKSLRSE